MTEIGGKIEAKSAKLEWNPPPKYRYNGENATPRLPLWHLHSYPSISPHGFSCFLSLVRAHSFATASIADSGFVWGELGQRASHCLNCGQGGPQPDQRMLPNISAAHLVKQNLALSCFCSVAHLNTKPGIPSLRHPPKFAANSA